MAITSLNLGEHWESFINSQIKTGRYSSASDVVRDALRHLEELNDKRAALRSHLAEGEVQAKNGEFIKDLSVDSLIDELDME